MNLSLVCHCYQAPEPSSGPPYKVAEHKKFPTESSDTRPVETFDTQPAENFDTRTIETFTIHGLSLRALASNSEYFQGTERFNGLEMQERVVYFEFPVFNCPSHLAEDAFRMFFDFAHFGRHQLDSDYCSGRRALGTYCWFTGNCICSRREVTCNKVQESYPCRHVHCPCSNTVVLLLEKQERSYPRKLRLDFVSSLTSDHLRRVIKIVFENTPSLSYCGPKQYVGGEPMRAMLAAHLAFYWRHVGTDFGDLIWEFPEFAQMVLSYLESGRNGRSLKRWGCEEFGLKPWHVRRSEYFQ